MRLNLNDVHVHILALVDLLSSDDISDINNTFVTHISTVIEIDMLCIVVGLVN